MWRKQKLPFNGPYVLLLCYVMQVGDVKMLPRRQYRIVRYIILCYTDIMIIIWMKKIKKPRWKILRRQCIADVTVCERWRINHGNNTIIFVFCACVDGFRIHHTAPFTYPNRTLQHLSYVKARIGATSNRENQNKNRFKTYGQS